MARPMWLVSLLKRYFPYRNQIAKITKLPVISKAVDHLVFEDDHVVYLPRDRVVINQLIERPEDMMLPSEVVHHFIDQASHHWIMNHCICRQAEHCQDYPVDLGCLFLGESVLKINPKLGRLVTREEAHAHEERAREAGLVHLIGRNKLDSLWLGANPGSRLMTICNCCPCCCLFRVLPHLETNIANRISRMPGVQFEVTDACISCGKCTRDVCFVDAIHLNSGKAEISDACRGCGRCVDVCPQGAIKLSIKDNQFIQNTIDGISSVVDVH
jgi:ferredoxin